MTISGERTAVETALALAPSSPLTDGDLESDTPVIETEAYRRSLPRWQKCRDLMIGVEAIRAGGTNYLPQHPSESNARYNKRRVIAGLFNGYARTVLASVGLIVHEEPKLGDDMPQELKDLWESIDGCGTHGAVFTKRLVQAGIIDGFAGILTEYPRANDPRLDRSKASLAATKALETGAPLDAADEKALGLRPYFILVKADQVLLPLYETVNGKRTLVMLILKENVTERKGRFGIKAVTRYRVYELNNQVVTYELWREEDGKAVRTEGPTALRNITAIPWSPLPCGEEIGPNEYKPTLSDLADLNIEYHNIKTGILNLEDLAFVPTPVRIGAEPDSQGKYPELILGPSNTIEAPAIEGVSQPLYWLSPPIDVLDPGMKSLESTKAEMGAMGASFLTPQPKEQETATAHRMDATAEQASIASVSRATQDCLESAFGFAGEFIRKPGGSVAMNQDFIGEGVSTEFINICLSAYTDNLITKEEFRYALLTGQLPETFNPDDVKKLVDRDLEQTKAIALSLRESRNSRTREPALAEA
jgi:hypothetical protein